MARRVEGAKPPPGAAQTSSMGILFAFEGPNPKDTMRVTFTCDGCGKEARIIGQGNPEGWQERYAGLAGFRYFCSPGCWEPYDERHKGMIYA